jgi:hypothetical protein
LSYVILHVCKKAKWIGGVTRKLVAVIADTLYLAIAFQLVRVLTCIEVGDEVVLLADNTVVCWEGSHQTLAIAAASGLSFYISLSVMLAPLIIAGDGKGKEEEGEEEDVEEGGSDDDEEEEDEVQGKTIKSSTDIKETIVFVKPYMMLNVKQ